jgi:hypothetical protein
MSFRGKFAARKQSSKPPAICKPPPPVLPPPPLLCAIAPLIDTEWIAAINWNTVAGPVSGAFHFTAPIFPGGEWNVLTGFPVVVSGIDRELAIFLDYHYDETNCSEHLVVALQLDAGLDYTSGEVIRSVPFLLTWSFPSTIVINISLPPTLTVSGTV